MAKPLNKHTLIVRNAVTNWIQRTNPPTFNVPMLIGELYVTLCYLDIDLSKAVSNELNRREKAGFIECVNTEIVGLGRPPKLYKQRWRY